MKASNAFTWQDKKKYNHTLLNIILHNRLFPVGIVSCFFSIFFLYSWVSFEDPHHQGPSIILNNIAQTNEFLLNRIANEDIVKDVLETPDFFSLRFENDFSYFCVGISREIILNFKIFYDEWNIFIEFTNHQFFRIEFLGNPIIIHSESIVLNPNKYFPLTAYINVETPIIGRFDIEIMGKDQNSANIVQNFTKSLSKSHSIPVIGLYENHRNIVRLTFRDRKNMIRSVNSVQIVTEEIPRNLFFDSKIRVPRDETDSKARNWYFLYHRFIIDSQGYLRWYYNLPDVNLFSFNFMLSNGLIAISFQDAKDFYLYDFMGNLHRRYNVTTGWHHEISEVYPGGNFFVLTNDASGNFTQDIIYEIDRESGTVAKSWNLTQLFDPNRPIIEDHVDMPKFDWLHLNTVWYDPDDDTLLISARNQHFFAKIGYTDAKIKWIAGNHNNWTSEYSKYLLAPINFNTTLHPDFDWTYFQHKPTKLRNGNYIVYDDGGARPGCDNYPNPIEESFRILHFNYSHIYNGKIPFPGFARVVEYKIDTENMQIIKIWEYTDFPTLPEMIVGSVEQIEEDLVLIGYGELRAISIVDKKINKTKFLVITGAMFYRVSLVLDFYHYFNSM